MKVRRFLILLLLLCVTATDSSAQSIMSEIEEFSGAAELKSALDGETRRLLKDADPTKITDFSDQLFFVLRDCAGKIVEHVQDDLAFAVRLIVTVVLCCTVDSFAGRHGKNAVSYAGVLGVMVLCVKEFQAMIDLGKETIMRLYGFTTALNPVMAAASAASGASASAGVNYGLTVFFSNILLNLCVRIIVPGLYAYFALAFTDSVLREDRLKPLRGLVGWSVEWALKGVVYAFTGCLAITGVLGGAADAVKLKAAKTAISTMIPVVGGIISGAAETVLTGASVLKSTVGTFGFLAVLAIMLLPFLRLLVKWMLLKLVAVFGGVLGASVNGLLEAASKGTGYLLAMTGAGTVISLLSCCCYLKVVHV